MPIARRAYGLIPEVALNPALGVGPGHKGLHEGNVGLHGCPSSCRNLSDPDRLAKLLVQAAGSALDGAQVCSIGVIAEGMDRIPGSWRVGVQRLHHQHGCLSQSRSRCVSVSKEAEASHSVKKLKWVSQQSSRSGSVSKGADVCQSVEKQIMAASTGDGCWRSYIAELTEPACSSPDIVAVGIPSAVNGAGSNQLDSQGVELAHQLWPQTSSSNRVHHIAWAAPSKRIVGLIEGHQVCGLGGQS